MKIGIIVTEDSPNWGGEVGIGNFIKERFSVNSEDYIKYEVICAVSGSLPKEEDILTYTGFVISGSHHSVNDNSEWIERLEEFIRRLYNMTTSSKPKLFGICFGHQLIAKALGGVVTNNLSGVFKFGSDAVDLNAELIKQDFYQDIFGDSKSFKIFQSHGEEVSVLPNGAIPIGKSATCLYEVLKYGDHIITTQGHPEMTVTKMKEVIMPRLITKGIINENKIQSNSFKGVDTDTLVSFVISFLTKITPCVRCQ